MQILKSFKSILKNNHINRPLDILKHLQWQFIKFFNLYPRVLNFSNSKLIAHQRSCGVCALVNSQNLYDYNIMNLLKKTMKGKIFFDIGANIGSYSILVSENENCKVYAFEPHPITFKYLEENIKINARTNVNLVNLALSNKKGEIDFSNNPGSAENSAVHIKDIKNTIKVKTTTLDTFCEEHNIFPNIIKIDVEGFEKEVIEGAQNILKNVELLIIEINNKSLSRFGNPEPIYSILKKSDLEGPVFYNHDQLKYKSINRFNEDEIWLNKNSNKQN